MLKKLNNTKVLKWIAGPVLVTGVYLGALQYWSWKWDTPNTPLPANHLNHQATIETDTAGFTQMAQSKMRELAEKLQSVSMSGAMMKDGKLVWAGSIGLASVESNTPASLATQYRIGSVSKPVTAIALMKMVENGLIELDAPIQNYLSDYPTYETVMTPRQLLSHMAGVRHYRFDITKFPPTDGLSDYPYEDAIAALTQFQSDELSFKPGQGFAYSTHGYTLLSAVMQAAGGKTFEALLSEHVTEPLGLEHTMAEHMLVNDNLLAEFYTSDEGLYGVTPPQNLSNKVAGGGLVSTPTELASLGAALLDNRLLTEESFAEMVAVQPMFDGSENKQGYALGWRHYETSHILGENNKVDVIHHGGVSVGANAFFMLVPEHNISVAIMTNGKGKSSRRDIQMLAYQLSGMAIKQEQETGLASLQSKD